MSTKKTYPPCIGAELCYVNEQIFTAIVGLALVYNQVPISVRGDISKTGISLCDAIRNNLAVGHSLSICLKNGNIGKYHEERDRGKRKIANGNYMWKVYVKNVKDLIKKGKSKCQQD